MGILKLKWNRLDKKLSIETIATILNCNNTTVYWMHKNYKLRLFVDEDIWATPKDAIIDCQDQNTGEEIYSIIEPAQKIKGTKKILSVTNEAITSFEYRNIIYYPTKTNLRGETKLSLISSRFAYCNKDQLKKLYNSDKNIQTSKPLKSASILEQRISAFKTYLATKSIKTITNDSQYQDCYNSLGSPTREKVWSELQKVEPQLFKAGKDDFFNIKRGQSIVNFKYGTGKSR